MLYVYSIIIVHGKIENTSQKSYYNGIDVNFAVVVLGVMKQSCWELLLGIE